MVDDLDRAIVEDMIAKPGIIHYSCTGVRHYMDWREMVVEDGVEIGFISLCGGMDVDEISNALILYHSQESGLPLCSECKKAAVAAAKDVSTQVKVALAEELGKMDEAVLNEAVIRGLLPMNCKEGAEDAV